MTSFYPPRPAALRAIRGRLNALGRGDGSAFAVALAGFGWCAGRPGCGLLLVAFLAIVPLVVWEVSWLCGAGDRPEAGQDRSDAQ
jgi:hypothetical protein